MEYKHPRDLAPGDIMIRATTGDEKCELLGWDKYYWNASIIRTRYHFRGFCVDRTSLLEKMFERDDYGRFLVVGKKPLLSKNA